MESWKPVALLTLAAFLPSARAQQADGVPGVSNGAVSNAAGPPPNMPAIAQALGVQCAFCHAGARKTEGQPPSKYEIARAMIAMTRDLNAKVQAATGKAPSEATQVTCVTCHRGVAVPGQLGDIIAKTAFADGPDAAIAQYRDLRQRYYGGQAYDFREDTLLDAGEKLTRVKPQSAIPILRLNLEFYPKSVRSYAEIAFAYTRSLNDEAAIAELEKAVEIEPDNGTIRGQLEQLKSYHRKR
jgi:tetratricopeptide (TPR) repeat protein